MSKRILDNTELSIIKDTPDSELLEKFPREEYGYSREELREIKRNKHITSNPNFSHTNSEESEVRISGNYAEGSVLKAQTYDEVIALLNMDLEVWEPYVVEAKPYRAYRKKKDVDLTWENGKIVSGYVKDKGEITTAQLFSWHIKFRRTSVKDYKEIVSNLVQKLVVNSKSVPKIPTISRPDGERHIIIYNFFDIHFGKVTWGEDNNNDFETKKKEIWEAVLILNERSKSFQCEKVIVPVGQDLFNSVFSSQPTTVRGTPQQSDYRWQIICRQVWELLVDLIAYLQQVYGQVVIPIIPGNHSDAAEFMVGEILQAYFHNNENVVVDNTPDKARKHYLYGHNMISFDHGRENSPKDLVRLMSTEEPSIWSKASYRYMYCGEIHRTRTVEFISTEDYNGAKVKYLPSLTATDEWHQKKGYVGNIRGCKCHVHSFMDGLVGEYSHNLGRSGIRKDTEKIPEISKL